MLTVYFIWLSATLFYAIEFFYRVAPSVIHQVIIHQYHLNLSQFGGIMAFYFYAYAGAQIPVGILFDRYQPTRILSFAAFSVSMGTLMMTYGHHPFVLLLSRLVLGFSSAFGFIGCLKIIQQRFAAKEHPKFIGLTNTLGIIGALCAEVPLTYFIHHIPWHDVMLSLALISLCISLILWASSICTTFHRPVLKSPWKQLSTLNYPPILRNSIIAGLMVAPVIAFAELWAIPYLENVFRLDELVAAKADSFVFIGIAVGGPIFGWLAKKIKNTYNIFIFSIITSIILMTSLLLLSHPAIMLINSLLFWVGFMASAMLLAFTLNGRHQPKDSHALITAITNSIIMIIGGTMQWFIGHLLYHYPHQYFMTIYILLLTLLIAFLIAFYEKNLASNIKNDYLIKL